MTPSIKAQLTAVNDLIDMLSRPTTQEWGGAKHRGIDYGKPAHTPYRAIEGGQIVGRYHTTELGNIVEVHGSSGYIAYAHVLNPKPLGTVVVIGGTIGEIAGPGDDYATGTVTQGNHEHIALESFKGGYAAGNIGKNPAKVIAKKYKQAITRAHNLSKIL